MQFIRGVECSIAFANSMPLFVQSRTLYTKVATCFMLNGVIVIGSMAFLSYILIPLLHILVPLEGEADPSAAQYAQHFHSAVIAMFQVRFFFLS
jgi:hypothetical protein